MSESAEIIENELGNNPRRAALVAALVSLIGIADSAYLTAKHYTDKDVPCSIITGCSEVLKSQYAEIYGIPTAAFGLMAYFLAFSLAVLVFYGNFKFWNPFGALATVMAVFTLWLLYLQAFVIGAFCQFCLISAATSIILFIIFIVSKILLKR